jgi:hypothetical protein
MTQYHEWSLAWMVLLDGGHWDGAMAKWKEQAFALDLRLHSLSGS